MQTRSLRSRSRVDWAVEAARRVRGGLVIAALKVHIRRSSRHSHPHTLLYNLIDRYLSIYDYNCISFRSSDLKIQQRLTFSPRTAPCRYM